ncbi:MAG TPA: hypothetical protein VMH83_15485 [Candidatus Acidoferrum sp.]|nr:hypothetical protein [Candidatus Acidoferrum sp.]
MNDKPEVGLVIRHLYLWRYEETHGKDQGRKARPCVIIRIHENAEGETEVYIAPLTHVDPGNDKISLEIPQATKRRLKLDQEKSWVITNEVNRFTWKGPDVVATPSGAFAYGYLPAGFIKVVIQQIRDNAINKQLGVVERDDENLKRHIKEEVAARTKRGQVATKAKK